VHDFDTMHFSKGKPKPFENRALQASERSGVFALLLLKYGKSMGIMKIVYNSGAQLNGKRVSV